MNKRDFEKSMPEIIETIKKAAGVSDTSNISKVVIGSIDPNTGEHFRKDVTEEVLPCYCPECKIVNVPCEQLQEYQPAVFFNDYNVYTKDGCVAVPTTVYNTLNSINDTIVEDVLKNATEVTSSFDKFALDNAMISNTAIVCDGFLATLMNIYNVFIARLNDATNGDLHFQYNPELFNTNNFDDAIFNLLNSSDTRRQAILNGSLATYTYSFVNSIGTDIYNNIRAYMFRIWSRASENDVDMICSISHSIDSCFSSMMRDMNFEVATFVYNMGTMMDHMLSANPE